QTYSPDLTVMAAGAWSGTLAKSLGVTLPMQGGKGYSLTLDHFSSSPQIPAILTEAKVTVTPMENQLRFAGTLEIAGENLSVNMRRVKGLLSSVSRYYPQIDPEIPVESKVWKGLRPCSPDGLPYIGYSHKYRNLIFATGHAMMGVSLAPVTGKLVSQLVERKNPEILKMLIPERY
ncbi:MAG: FAD-dependent oxidoreductase, partial [Bacteroidia bacterium]